MTSSFKHSLFLSVATALIAVAVPFSAGAASSNASKEIATAAKHAGYAAKAGSLNEVHLHLHHVINCLVGPKGKGYAEQFADPCKGQGNGAINDMTDASKSDKKSVEKALALAKTGVTAKSKSTGTDTAQTVEKLLKSAE